MPWAEGKYDVAILGILQFFHYDEGIGTNPTVLMQVILIQVIRHKRIISDNRIVVRPSLCNDYFHDELWPYTREVYSMFQHDLINVLPDMNRYDEYFATGEKYIRRYRYCNTFYPFCGFSIISCDHIAEMNISAIYLYDAQKPGYAGGMGLKIRATIGEALADTKEKFVGQNPNILVLPQTFRLSAARLIMKDEAYKGKGQEDYGCACHMYEQMVQMLQENRVKKHYYRIKPQTHLPSWLF